jgi:hypothetical protein
MPSSTPATGFEICFRIGFGTVKIGRMVMIA